MWENFFFGEPKPWAITTLYILRLLSHIFAIIVLFYVLYCFFEKVGDTFTKIDEIHKALVTNGEKP